MNNYCFSGQSYNILAIVQLHLIFLFIIRNFDGLNGCFCENDKAIVYLF